MTIVLHNSYLTLPELFRVPHEAAHVPLPDLIVWNEPLAATLGVSSWQDDAAERFSGNRRARYSTPVALGYAGHQFGHFVPQLGDGRALLLGERIDEKGQRFDLQLKGSGRTAFSRGGDGKSPLGPVLREYLVSEAMHALGVPTTRSLAAVTTGETVLRETAQPGAVLTRVARSHLRVGTFELAAARGDHEALRALIDYACARHLGAESPSAMALFDYVVQAQAMLVAHWMAIGFVHGVMNTDNTAISGETIDYGPCAFLDEFVQDKVFSSIDQYGRYAYGQQPAIAAWNLSRLAGCLLLVHDDRATFEAVLGTFSARFRAAYEKHMAAKFGWSGFGDGDEELLSEWLGLLETHSLDYTRSWHTLAGLWHEDGRGDEDGSAAGKALREFAVRWRVRTRPEGEDALEKMRRANPIIIPRNHRIAHAIDAAEQGNLAPFHAFHTALRRPFDPGLLGSPFAEAPGPGEHVTRTFCGT